MLKTELRESHDRLIALRNNFNEVSPEFIDTIICEIMAEESRFNTLLKMARQMKEE